MTDLCMQIREAKREYNAASRSLARLMQRREDLKYKHVKDEERRRRFLQRIDQDIKRAEARLELAKLNADSLSDFSTDKPPGGA